MSTKTKKAFNNPNKPLSLKEAAEIEDNLRNLSDRDLWDIYCVCDMIHDDQILDMVLDEYGRRPRLHGRNPWEDFELDEK